MPVPEHLDLGSDFEFPAQTGQLAISPPSNAAPSPFMQFAASMPNHGTLLGKNKCLIELSFQKCDGRSWILTLLNNAGFEVIYEMFHILNCGFESK